MEDDDATPPHSAQELGDIWLIGTAAVRAAVHVAAAGGAGGAGGSGGASGVGGGSSVASIDRSTGL